MTKMGKEETLKSLIDCGAIAVIRLAEPNKLIKVAQSIYEGGVIGIEITMTVPDAINVIKKAAAELGNYMNIGVGTVLDAVTAQKAIDAGAKYVVSPVFKKKLSIPHTRITSR